MAQKKSDPGKYFVTEVGKNILKLRKRKGLSLNTLGWAIGSDKMEISKIQKGKNITLLTLLKISIALKVSPSELLKLTGEFNEEDLEKLISSNKANKKNKEKDMKKVPEKNDLVTGIYKATNRYLEHSKKVKLITDKLKIKGN